MLEIKFARCICIYMSTCEYRLATADGDQTEALALELRKRTVFRPVWYVSGCPDKVMDAEGFDRNYLFLSFNFVYTFFARLLFTSANYAAFRELLFSHRGDF